MDDRGRAPGPAAGDQPAGAAQPQSGRARPAARGRHQRLGRHLAGDARSRQSRGALAGDRAACAARPRPRARSWWRAWRSIRATSGRRSAGSRPRCARPSLDHADAEGYAREDRWVAGAPAEPVAIAGGRRERADRELRAILRRARAGHTLDEAEVVRLFAARGREVGGDLPGGRRAAPGGQRRAGRLRRQPQHQLHQRLLLRLPLLRVLQGQARGASARPGLRSRPRGDRAPHPRGLAARRDRGVPAGRHPSRLHGRDLPRDLPDREGGGARDPRPRLLAARGLAGRADARRSRSASSWPSSSGPGSARCPAPRPRSWTTRCAA